MTNKGRIRVDLMKSKSVKNGNIITTQKYENRVRKHQNKGKKSLVIQNLYKLDKWDSSVARNAVIIVHVRWERSKIKRRSVGEWNEEIEKLIKHKREHLFLSLINTATNADSVNNK